MPQLTNGNGYLMNGNHDPSTVYQNGHLTEQSDDEYIDTVEDEPETLSARSISSVSSSQHVSRSKVRNDSGSVRRTVAQLNGGSGVNEDFTEVLNLLNSTVDRMSVDLQQVTNRINIMERSLLEVRYMHASRVSVLFYNVMFLTFF